MSPPYNSQTPVIDFRMRVPRDREWPEFMERYNELLDLERKMEFGIDDIVDEMDRNGVDKAVLHAEFEHGEYRSLNTRVADIVDEYPDRFIGFASVDPRDGMEAVRELDRCVRDLGLSGLNLQPFVYELDPTDAKYYPLYSKCVEYDIPVGLHTGVNYTTKSFEVGNPLYHETVLCDFPDLSMIALHVGWPWVAEATAIARKHPNYYLELGGLAPEYITMENGWAPLTAYMNTILKDQLLFATDFPVLDQERVLEQVRGLEPGTETLDQILGGNAAELLEL